MMAAAYLFCDDDVLMMKRADTLKFFPGVWAPVGGHVQPSEINDPYSTCLREIEEETGLKPDDISGLALRFIILRMKGSEVRQQFTYFGRIKRRDVPPCGEGEFHFIPIQKAVALHMSIASTLMLQKYRETGDDSTVLVGTVWGEPGQPQVTWAPLKDWGDRPV
jgi:8-oxo-dGTP diphosphatase